MFVGTVQAAISPGMHTPCTSADGRMPLETHATMAMAVHRSAWCARIITSLRRAARPQRRAVVAVDHEVAVVLQLESGARILGRPRRPERRPAVGIEHEVAIELHQHLSGVSSRAGVPQ